MCKSGGKLGINQIGELEKQSTFYGHNALKKSGNRVCQTEAKRTGMLFLHSTDDHH